VATWNVLTLTITGYQDPVTRELCRLNVDIACLTEERLEGSGKQVVEEHTLIHWGKKIGTGGFVWSCQPKLLLP